MTLIIMYYCLAVLSAERKRVIIPRRRTGVMGTMGITYIVKPGVILEALRLEVTRASSSHAAEVRYLFDKKPPRVAFVPDEFEIKKKKKRIPRKTLPQSENFCTNEISDFAIFDKKSLLI